jgi:hypothetical protein
MNGQLKIFRTEMTESRSDGDSDDCEELRMINCRPWSLEVSESWQPLRAKDLRYTIPRIVTLAIMKE